MKCDRPLYACADCGRSSTVAALVTPRCGPCEIQAEIDKLEDAHQPSHGDLDYVPASLKDRAAHRRALKRKHYGNGVD